MNAFKNLLLAARLILTFALVSGLSVDALGLSGTSTVSKPERDVCANILLGQKNLATAFEEVNAQSKGLQSSMDFIALVGLRSCANVDEGKFIRF